MGSPFDAAMRAADRTLDSVFGEPFRVEPLAPGAGGDRDAPLGPDPARPPQAVTMTYQEAGDDYSPTSRGVAANTAQRRTGADLRVSVLGHRLPYALRAGDRIVREGTGVAYRLNAPEPDDAGRIWFPITRA